MRLHVVPHTAWRLREGPALAALAAQAHGVPSRRSVPNTAVRLGPVDVALRLDDLHLLRQAPRHLGIELETLGHLGQGAPTSRRPSPATRGVRVGACRVVQAAAKAAQSLSRGVHLDLGLFRPARIRRPPCASPEPSAQAVGLGQAAALPQAAA